MFQIYCNYKWRTCAGSLINRIIVIVGILLLCQKNTARWALLKMYQIWGDKRHCITPLKPECFERCLLIVT